MSDAPVQPRSREFEIIKVLFDKHLLHRAINLAEVRWAGSGEVVRLAYEWRDLAPGERRTRLEQIGPDRLSQFRVFGDLDPELAQVLDDLAGRGVLEAVQFPADTTEQDEVVPSQDDMVSAEEGVDEPASDEPSPAVEHTEAEPVEADPIEDDTVIDPGVEVELTDDVRSMIEASLPHTDLSPESIDEVVANEQRRRAEAVASGEEMLQRVRDRLDSTARRVESRPGRHRQPAPAAFPRMTAASTSPASVTLTTPPGEQTFTAPPEFWLQRLREERVIVVDGTSPAPSDDELVAIANELGLGIEEFDLGPGLTRALFGGLRRTGSSIEVEVGPLPAALAHGCLAVVRGRMMPSMLKRLQAGMCDIPGTRATVRLSDETRVLNIP